MHLISRVSSQRTLAWCQPLLTSQPRPWILQGPLYNSASRPRSLTSTSPLYKKKDKSKPAPAAAPEPSTSKNAPLTDDPYDLSRVESGIADAASRLKDDLSRLRAGGRLNTATIESLPVYLKKGSTESVKLGELAQVVPKSGRMTTVLASEEEHIKPISSAIVGSDLSLTPQADPHNSLQINIPIPPPTKESRDQTTQAAKQAWEKASNAIRDSRGAMHKHLQQLEKKKIARGDDVRSAHGKMEKLVEKGQKDVKELFEVAKRGLEKV